MRIVGVAIDPPSQNAAMIEKLSLPFPILSDPDRTSVIDPYGVADPKDPRRIARPAMVLIDPDGEERWRFVSRDFADRLPESEVLDRAGELGLAPVQAEAVALGPAEPGPKAMPFDWLMPYFRGARFASLAMGLRHGGLDQSVKDDSKAYVAQMDRFMEVVKALEEARADRSDRPGE